jgi:hypothetical protein
MSKVVTIKLIKMNPTAGPFTITDNLDNEIAVEVSKDTLVFGISYTVDDAVTSLTIASTGECTLSKVFPLDVIDAFSYAAIDYVESVTSDIWRHLKDTTKFNNFYGKIKPYILEYPFAFQYQDEILQNVKDYSRVYKYTSGNVHSFNRVSRTEINDAWFNKAVLYNGQQSSGVLQLIPKPANNLKVYSEYPKFNVASKSILYTKSDNFYNYNTFWSVVINQQTALFMKSCESMSIDKEVNQDNMDYSMRSFRKEPLRAKELRIRHILDDRNDIHIVSQFVVTELQKSQK